MLKDYWFSLEAGGEDETPPVGGHHGEWARRLHVDILKFVKRLGLGVPEVDLREGVIAAKSEVESVREGERLEDHGSSRGKRLHLRELLVGPIDDFGVTDVAGQSQVQATVHSESFDGHHVVYVWDLAVECELQGAFVPQVDDWWLRAAG